MWINEKLNQYYQVYFCNKPKAQLGVWGMKYTQTTLDKLSNILGESNYVVRYERGTFQSGWCLLEERRIVVLNKFLSVEGRINTLMDIIPQLNIEFDKLTHESQKLYEELVKKSTTEA